MTESHRGEIAKLEALYSANPGGRIFTHLAEAYRRAGELDRARATVEEGLGRHAEYPSAHVVHGRVLTDLGEVTAAEGAFRRVLELDPENRVALRALGDLAWMEERADDALERYHALQLLDPGDEEVEALVRMVEAARGDRGAVDGPGEPARVTDLSAGDEPIEPAGEWALDIEPTSSSEAQNGVLDAEEVVDLTDEILATPGDLDPLDGLDDLDPLDGPGDLDPLDGPGGLDDGVASDLGVLELEETEAEPEPLDGLMSLEMDVETTAPDADDALSSVAGLEGFDTLDSGSLEAEEALPGFDEPIPPFEEPSQGGAPTADEAEPSMEFELDPVAEFEPTSEAEPIVEPEPIVEAEPAAAVEPAVEFGTPPEIEPAGEPELEEFEPADLELDDADRAMAEPAELELGQDDVVAAEPEEIELGEAELAFAEPEEIVLGEAELAFAEPEEVVLGEADVVVAEPVEADSVELELGDADLAVAEPATAPVMTQTMAELYARQGLHGAAAEIYRELLRSRPDDALLRARLAEAESEAASARVPVGGETGGGEGGWAGDAVLDVGGPTIGAYLRTLLEFVPAAAEPEEPAGSVTEASAADFGVLTDEPAAPSDGEPDEYDLLFASGGAEGPDRPDSGVDAAAEAPVPEPSAPEMPVEPMSVSEAPDPLGTEAEASPAGDDDVEMFRAWLQNLKR